MFLCLLDLGFTPNQLKIVCLLDLHFRSRFLCAFYMFGSVRFQFGKQNFDWLVRFGQNSKTLVWSVTTKSMYKSGWNAASLTKLIATHCKRQYQMSRATFKVFSICIKSFYSEDRLYLVRNMHGTFVTSMIKNAMPKRVEQATSREILWWKQGYPVSINSFPCNREKPVTIVG